MDAQRLSIWVVRGRICSSNGNNIVLALGVVRVRLCDTTDTAIPHLTASLCCPACAAMLGDIYLMEPEMSRHYTYSRPRNPTKLGYPSYPRLIFIPPSKAIHGITICVWFCCSEKKEPKYAYLLPGLFGLANAFLTSWAGGLISSFSLSGVISSAADASIYMDSTKPPSASRPFAISSTIPCGK